MSIRKHLSVFMLGLLITALLSPVVSAQAPRSSVLPSGGGAALLDPSDTVLLLLDHQTGLFQTVKDVGITELRNNTVLLAKVATMTRPLRGSMISLKASPTVRSEGV